MDDHDVATDDVLAIDVGATNIKFARVDAQGAARGSIKRRPTPYPCPPDRLVNWVAQRIRNFDVVRVGVGFPGEFEEGRVVRPGNLSRVHGVGSPIDEDLDARWRDFPLEEELRKVSGRDVRVVNDATMAALGCCRGQGLELVVALGTGCGLAVRVDGRRQRVRDLGRAPFDGSRTFDAAVGERARVRDESAWRRDVRDTLARLAQEFQPDRVYLAGGNARRFSPDEFSGANFTLDIVGNGASLRGAARLFA
jgi:polyphosphate glucokinase